MADMTLTELADAVERQEIRALSVKQPWPHRIFHEGKDIENRDWPTRYRGWFIIHAGKAYDGKIPAAHGNLPRGGIVGFARIVDCVSHSESKWWIGSFGFVLRDAFPIPLIPLRGQLGFFNIGQEAAALTAASLRAMEVE